MRGTKGFMSIAEYRYLQGFGFASVMLARGESTVAVCRWALDHAQTRWFQKGMFDAVSTSYGW